MAPRTAFLAPSALLVGLLLAAACTPGARPAPAQSPAPPPSAAGGAAAEAPVTAGAAPAAPSAAQELAPVRVGMQYIISDAGMLIADDRGYMREVGIDFQGQRMDTPQMQSALAAGQIEAAGTGPTAALLNAVLRGVRVKMVADRGTLAPGHAFNALIVRKDLVDSGEVREMRDLRGRRIALQPPAHAAVSWYLTTKLLEAGGLTEADVEYVPLAFADQNAALVGRSIDAAWQAEPGVTAVVESGLAVRFRGGEEAVGPISLAGLVYSEQFAAQTDLARRFMVAYVRGVRVYLDAFTRNQGRDDVVAVLTRHTAVKDPTLYDRMQVPYIHPDGLFDNRAREEAQEYYVRHGIMSQAVDMAQVTDLSFAEYAARQLGPYR